MTARMSRVLRPSRRDRRMKNQPRPEIQLRLLIDVDAWRAGS
jgi:hypothetical protein